MVIIRLNPSTVKGPSHDHNLGSHSAPINSPGTLKRIVTFWVVS